MKQTSKQRHNHQCRSTRYFLVPAPNPFFIFFNFVFICLKWLNICRVNHNEACSLLVEKGNECLHNYCKCVGMLRHKLEYMGKSFMISWNIHACVCVRPCVYFHVGMSSSLLHESRVSYICSINPSSLLAYDLALISISINMEMQHYQH